MSPELSTGIVAEDLRKGLDETGFVEGRNDLAVDFRFAYNDNTRLRNWRPKAGAPSSGSTDNVRFTPESRHPRLAGDVR